MRMTRLEKHLVNRAGKGAANIERVRRHLSTVPARAGGAALELGCGTGDVSSFLAAEYGLHVIGGDVDPEQVALARVRHGEHPGLRFAVVDARQLEFPAATFDLVVAQNVFHHIPEWRLAASEIARVLRPQGHVLWLDLTMPPVLRAVMSPLRHRVGLYSAAESRAAFRSQGLVERAVQPLLQGFRHDIVWQKIG